MALAAGTTWEARASGAGVADTNGGGYVPGSSGTDFSQQNSPQYALTGLASAGAGNTILSAAAAADMVGNIAQAVSGTNVNAGFYQVTSVSVGVSITFSTNNSGGSIATGVAASLVLNIGGALLTLAKVQSAVAASNTVYCVGTFTVTAAVTIATQSSAGPLSYIGYTATRTDNGQATVTTSTNSVDVFDIGNSQNVTFKNLTITVTAGTPGSGVNAKSTGDANRFRCVNCFFSGGDRCLRGNRSGAFFAIDGLSLEYCEVKSATNHGVNNGKLTWMIGCFIHDNGGSGYLSDSGNCQSTSFHTVFYKNGTSGANLPDSNVVPSGFSHNFWNCSFSTNTGAGILSTAGAPNLQIHNCIFDRNTTYGVDLGTAAGASFVVQYNNAFFNNTTAARRGNADVFPAIGDITLSADPYTTVGTNFALNSSAGGGTACKGTGAPGTIPNAGTGTASVGALDPATGGTTTIFAVECNTSIVLNRGGVAGY